MWTDLMQTMDRETLRALSKRAEDQGAVTTADIIELWPDAAEDLESAHDFLEAKGIEVEREVAAAERRPALSAHLEDVDSDDSISLYFREVGKIDLLKAEDEVDLAKRIEAGREAAYALSDPGNSLTSRARHQLDKMVLEGERARQQLTEANSRLVISMAKRYIGQGVPFLGSHPGGEPRPHEGRREVRLAPG